MKELNEVLQQSGIKGMRWGVHTDHADHGRESKRVRGFIGKRLNSLKRERQWKSVLKEMDNLSTQELTDVAKRVGLENSLKTLSRSKIGTKKDKEDYHQREHMDNEELSRKVTRLKAKESLHSVVKSASKEQRAFGQKVLHIGGSVAINYALSKTKPSIGDIFNTVKNSKSEFGKSRGELLKVALEKLKKANQPNP